MSYCSQCGAARPVGSVYCPSCGARTPPGDAGLTVGQRWDQPQWDQDGWDQQVTSSYDPHASVDPLSARTGSWDQDETSAVPRQAPYAAAEPDPYAGGAPADPSAPTPPDPNGPGRRRSGLVVALAAAVVLGLVAVAALIVTLTRSGDAPQQATSTSTTSTSTSAVSSSPAPTSNVPTSGAGAVNTTAPYTAGAEPVVDTGSNAGKLCRDIPEIGLPDGVFVYTRNVYGSCVFGQRIAAAYLHQLGGDPATTAWKPVRGLTVDLSHDQGLTSYNRDGIRAQRFGDITCTPISAFAAHCQHPAGSDGSGHNSDYYVYNNHLAPGGGN